MKMNDNEIAEYCLIVGDLLNNPKVKSMAQYNHHGKITTHFHSIYVSYVVFKWGKKLNINLNEAVRASLLHDLYLYDWHITKHEEKHAWYHPKAAVKNAERYVMELTEKQRDMILAHMWPLHIMPPKSKEGFVLTFADKHCANVECAGLSRIFIPCYNEIMKVVENYDK